jgi:hypothetical protein
LASTGSYNYRVMELVRYNSEEGNILYIWQCVTEDTYHLSSRVCYLNAQCVHTITKIIHNKLCIRYMLLIIMYNATA